ncbi:MAG: HEPN domain-containing protein [Methanoregula sp.]|uniref:ApeA N-terminal domain 1-containing protein n=1 Tax=Methanoregula sp. TaxID=2052170 RepID=UPI003FD8C295
MLSKSEYKGKWWIPADSHNEIDGTLKINPNGTGTLEIWGELIKEDFSEFPPTSEEVEIILGRTSEGSKITLFNCQLAGTSRSSEGFPLQTVNIATNILHVHFLTGDTISFRKLMVEFKHFEHLIKSTRIQVTNSSQVAIPINNVEREEIPFFSVDGFNIKIIVDVHSMIKRSPLKKITVEELPYILIEAETDRKYADYLKIIDKLQYFFTFCVLKTVYPVEIHGESAASTWEPPKDWNGTKDIGVIFEPIQIISHWVDLPDLSQVDEVDRNEILFILNEIRENSDFAMNKWWIKHEVYKSVFDIYFGTIFNSRMYLENTFLSLAQCIESYHRKSPRFLDCQIHPEEYQERIEIVKEAIKGQTQLTTSQKKSIIKTLKLGNGLSLETRIQQLLITYPTITPYIVGKEKNFPNTIALNRNNLTHLDPKPQNKYATFWELYDLSTRMRLLLITVFLDELGFDIKKIEKIVERLSRRYRLK